MLKYYRGDKDMNIRDFIPKSAVDYIRIIKNKKRFPNSNINTGHIGENVEIGEKVSLSKGVFIGDGVKIGKRTYIHDNTMIVSGEIGKYCSIAFNCQIGMWEHPIDYISTSPYTYASSNLFGFDAIWKHKEGPVIGNDVWIGSNSIILRGVVVGDGAIIGAGSIVTKDIPPYAVVVGAPAKIIKYRFDEEKIETLKKFKWWDFSEEELKKYKHVFMLGNKGPEELLKMISK